VQNKKEGFHHHLLYTHNSRAAKSRAIYTYILSAVYIISKIVRESKYLYTQREREREREREHREHV